MKRFLFAVALVLVTLVACKAKTDNRPPSTLRMVVDSSDTYPYLWKFHDDASGATCYVSSTGNGGGISCLRDEK